MKSSKPGAEKMASRLTASLPALSAEIQVPAGINTVARMYDSYRISDMNAGGSGLQKEDFVGLGMAVNLDFSPDRDACSHENQMRGPAILRVNLQDESLSGIGMPGPTARFAALALVLLEDESVALAKSMDWGSGPAARWRPHTREGHGQR
jgi:hypothetical protein